VQHVRAVRVRVEAPTDVGLAMNQAGSAIKGWLATKVVPPFGVAVELAATFRRRSRLAAFQQHLRVASRFPEQYTSPPPPRVIAVVTHLADPSRPASRTVDRLERTLEGLVYSLGHTDLELVLNTMPGRDVAEALPEHLRSRLVICPQDDVEPMFLGFRAQDIFVERRSDFDWFLYAEDDLVLWDPLLLEKLSYFARGAPPEALLLPHRYELWNGNRTYVDAVSRTEPEPQWNRLTMLTIGGWRFAEFVNPHSGFYCLSRPQLERWLASGRHWYGIVSYAAPRESAATGALMETFRIYKPHPANMRFLELMHWDTRFTERVHGPLRSEQEARDS
jgi:hypothetical protein